MRVTTRSVCMATASLFIFATFLAQGADLQPYFKKGQIVQQLNIFDNPEGSIFSADGKFVFISNAAELGMPDKGFHWVHNGGYISKLAVQNNGTLKMVNDKFITGLTGPLGMAMSTVATDKFPLGTIFIAEGWLPLAEADGTEVTDPKVLDPKIIAFNSEGRILGSIKIGTGSAIEKISGVIATQANSLAFDSDGNLFLADTAVPGDNFEPPIKTKRGGIYMFPVSSIDALSEDHDAPLYYIEVPNGGPDGIEIAPDGMIHFNTVGLNAGYEDPAGGGMYKVTKSDFMAGTLPPPINTGLGALDGLTFVAGKRLDAVVRNTNGIVVTPLSSGTPYRLTFDKDIQFAGPSDIAVHRMDDGSYLLIVPNLAGTGPNNKDDSVTVIRLPADF